MKGNEVAAKKKVSKKIFHTASGHLYKKTIEKDAEPKSMAYAQKATA